MKRSFTPGSAVPRQPRAPLDETALHLRLTSDRFLRRTASAADVIDAARMFIVEAEKVAEKGRG